MVRDHQNLSGSRDLTTPLLGIVYHPVLTLATINQFVKFEVFASRPYILRRYARRY